MRYASDQPDPGLVSAWTIIGGMGLVQDGDALIATSNTAKFNVAVQAIPAGQVTSKLWTMDLCGLWLPQSNTSFPELGVVVTDGVTSGVSNLYAMARYASSLGWEAETAVLNTQTRTVYSNTNSDFDYAYGQDALYMRVMSDATNILFQAGAGKYWRTYYSRALPGGTLGYYGFYVGTPTGSGLSGARIKRCKVGSPLTYTLASVTIAAGIGTFTTNAAHGMANGWSVTITGTTVSSGIAPNGVYDGNLTVTGPTTFTIGNGLSAGVVNGGTGTVTVTCV